MSDTVDSLPADSLPVDSLPVDSLPPEYVTPSLRSLPGDLQAMAVKAIRKKFGLTDPEADPGQVERANEAVEIEVKRARDEMYVTATEMYRQESVGPDMFIPSLKDFMVEPQWGIANDVSISTRRMCLLIEYTSPWGVRGRTHMDLPVGSDVAYELRNRVPELRGHRPRDINYRIINQGRN